MMMMMREIKKERERDGFKKECYVLTSPETILTFAVIGKRHSQTFSETELFISNVGTLHVHVVVVVVQVSPTLMI